MRYRQYMDAVRRAIIEAEGVLKPLYLSEIGWQNAEDRQVECMRVGVRCALDDPTVALCLWYGMQDDGAEVYGLYRKEGLATDHRKLVYEPFVALARENRLVPAAATQPAPLVDHATFAGEFDAIPDGTVLPPGSAFTKTWRLLNKGTTTWSAGYRLLRVSGHSLGAPASIAVPQCPPGQAVDLTVAFVAPTAAEDYKSTWQLVDPQGRPFGQQVWTEIKVRVAPVTLAVGGVALAELPLPAGPAAGQPAAAAALGIIYTTYWLRMLSASSAPDPQPAALAAANDALAQIREWLEQEA